MARYVGALSKRNINYWYAMQLERMQEEIAVTNSGVARQGNSMLKVTITPEENSLVNSLREVKNNGRNS